MSADGKERFTGAIPARLRRKAAEWLALREARGFTAHEHADFAEWLGADAQHRAAFAEIAAGWARLDGLAAYLHSPDAAPDPDLLAVPRRGVRWAVVGAAASSLAAVAAIVVAALWWWEPAPEVSQKESLTITTGSTPQARTVAAGSLVELSTGGEVREHFTLGERRVRLVQGTLP